MSNEEWYLLDRTGAASLVGQPHSIGGVALDRFYISNDTPIPTLNPASRIRIDSGP